MKKMLVALFVLAGVGMAIAMVMRRRSSEVID